MKTTCFIYSLILSVLFISCDNAETTFNSPFPKKNINLTDILGNEISLKRKTDTLVLNISGNQNVNLLTYNTGDTFFYGRISKYRGLYYFSEKIKEGSYFIYAVKITDSLIYGLDSDWSQMCEVEKEIKNGNNKKLLVFMNSDTSVIILHPYKDEMKKLYRPIINNIVPDTILFPSDKSEIKNNITKFDTEEMNLIQAVYPNPTLDFITVNLQNTGDFTYQISDYSGKIITNGNLTEKSNRIELTKLSRGYYILTVISNKDNQSETVKIAKIK